MLGLLEKDIRLTYCNRSMILLLLMSVGIGMAKESMILWYLPFIGMFLTFRCTSMDEMEHGMEFLLSLPVDRKSYVQEKYVYNLLTFGISLLLAEAINFLIHVIRKIDMVSVNEETVGMWCGLGIAVLVMTPITLKFGVEKSRIILFAFSGILVLLTKLALDGYGRDIFLQIEQSLNQIPDSIVPLVLGGVMLVVLAVSYCSSVAVMKKKEF